MKAKDLRNKLLKKSKKFREGYITITEDRIEAFKDAIFAIEILIDNEEECLKEAKKFNKKNGKK